MPKIKPTANAFVRSAVSWNIRGKQRDTALDKIIGEIADGKRY